MFCGNCGKNNKNGAVFCESCGAKLVIENKNFENKSETEQGVYASYPKGQFDENNIPEEYRPISMWGYFGYEILFAIPIVGFIILIVFSITAKNRNLKNFARSYFCIVIIVIVVLAIIMAATGIGLFRLGVFR